ncbi:MAG: alanine racemase [Clostridia bacterium]|nr:alanine racemase [Clostridia bacterium]
MDELFSQTGAIRKRTWAEIDLDAAKQNYLFLQSRLCGGAKMCCVIKANGYGHGAVELARLYEALGAAFFAVSNLEEALQLREAGLKLPVLILGYTPPACAPLLARYDIRQCVFSSEYGQALSGEAVRSKCEVTVHIKLDTGMGRIGFLCRGRQRQCKEAAQVCRLPGLKPEGVFTHFCVADEAQGQSATNAQFEAFLNGIEAIEKERVRFEIRHCANSAAILAYPRTHLDMARAGISLYGLAPSRDLENQASVVPVMTLKSVIAHIKDVQPGETVGYGATYVASETRRVATVCIGYADGLPRLCGQGRYAFLVSGCKAPILGRVCMDQVMIDVTGIDCTPGDEVEIFGRHPGFTAEDLASAAGTIGYETVCDVGIRVPRIYIRDGKAVELTDLLFSGAESVG